MSPSPRLYADYNATAPLRPEAKAALMDALSQTGNASSVHAEGRRARALVEAARERVAAAIGACRDDIVFTGGGTEAVQTPLRAVLADRPASLIVSAIEHDAVLSLAPLHDTWTVSPAGVVDIDDLERYVAAVAASGQAPLVSLMLVNNETGVLQPVAAAADIVHRAGGFIHCDAVQALGKTSVCVTELDVDYLSVSAHKIGGPQGVGAFYVRPGAPFRPMLTGGGQEAGRRSGTENVAGLAGFGAAAEAALVGLGAYEAFRSARDSMEAALQKAVPLLSIHGRTAPRVAGVSCFGVEGLPSETQVMGLDLAKIAVSAGAACSSGKVKPSRVLTAMGLSDTAARSAIRVSFGWASQPDDFATLAGAWLNMVGRARPQLVKLDAHV